MTGFGWLVSASIAACVRKLRDYEWRRRRQNHKSRASSLVIHKKHLCSGAKEKKIPLQALDTSSLGLPSSNGVPIASNISSTSWSSVAVEGERRLGLGSHSSEAYSRCVQESPRVTTWKYVT